MADSNDQAEEKTGAESTAMISEGAPALRLTGIAAIPFVGVRIGSEPNPLSKGQRKHLRRKKEAGQPKVASRRSQASRLTLSTSNGISTMHQPVAPSGAGQWTGKRVIVTTLGALLVGLGFWLVSQFYGVAFILFAAVVLGTAIRPAVDWLYRRGLRREAGLILVYFTLLALLIGFVLLLTPLMLEQTRSIVAKLPGYYLSLHAALATSQSGLIQRLAQQLPSEFVCTDPGRIKLAFQEWPQPAGLAFPLVVWPLAGAVFVPWMTWSYLMVVGEASRAWSVNRP